MKITFAKKMNKDYDVIVCGGGIAGISASLSASRQGKKVLLIEKQNLLGGLATLGLVTIYLPLCDGLGHQVSFGIAEELLRLSIKYGAEKDYPANWLDDKGTRTEADKRFQVRYNAQLFALLVERLLIDTGVEILYGSYVVDVHLKNKKIDKVIVENKSGRNTYRASSVVDATGDCDIAHFAGVPTETFEKGNDLAGWYYYTDKNGYDLRTLGVVDRTDEENNNAVKPLTSRRFSGLDGKELSEMVQLSHQASLNDWLKRRETDNTAVISTLATIPQVRMTRKIVGEYTLKEVEEHTYFESAIGLVSNWKKRGPVYEIPFETLYNKKVKNLIVAGRCISVSEEMWDVMRVIPCCAVTGQAVGVAATMTDDFSTLDIAKLQQELKNQGVVLHNKDIELSYK